MWLSTTTDARSEIVFAPPTVGCPQMVPPSDDQSFCRDGVHLVVSLTKAKPPGSHGTSPELQLAGLQSARPQAARLKSARWGSCRREVADGGKGVVFCFREAPTWGTISKPWHATNRDGVGGLSGTRSETAAGDLGPIWG